MKNPLAAHPVAGTHPAARPLLRALPLTIAAALLAFGAGNAALAAAAHGGGARAGFGARSFAGRGFARPGFPGRGGRFGPYYGWPGWGPGWGWGWGFGLGWYVPVLPLYYSTLWWDGVPYYYADNDYYEWNPTVGQYEAVVPPPGVTQQIQGGLASAPGAPGNSELFAYPKNGQSSAQQATDKEQCRAWARSQVGAAPDDNSATHGSEAPGAPGSAVDGASGSTRGNAAGSDATAVGALQQAAAGSASAPPAGPPAAAGTAPPAPADGVSTAGAAADGAATNEAQRAAYLRAEAACLTGRGYSVQ